jgi:hypothetical protein
MAEQKSNWLWWTLGGVALLGVGVGTYLYFRGRTTGKQLKNDGKVYIPPVVPPPSTTSTSTSGSISVTVPFKNEMEGNAFRDWVNNNYAAWAKTNELDRKGKHNNSYIQKAWAKYGVEYSEYLNKANSAAQGTGIQDLQKVMNAMKDYTIEANSSERVQFMLYDGAGLKNVRANFTPSGYFWIEMDMYDDGRAGLQKFDGSWSFANDKFNVKLNDNTFNGTDANLSGMLWALAKKKFPLTLGSMNADGLDDMLNMAGKQYVDSQDSML